LVEIKGLEKLAPRDFPGYISATLFTGGCNFRCPYCHNADLVLRPGSLATISRESIWEFLDDRQGWLEAVCVTGGEPLMHEDLDTLLKQIKARDLFIKVDTNGSYPRRLEALVEQGLLDFIAMDIKAPLENYAHAAGVSVDIQSIQESISVIRDSGCRYAFRTTVVPGLVKEDDAVVIAQLLNGVDHFILQPFMAHQTLDPEYSQRPSTSKEQLLRMADRAREFIPRVTVEGN
jgi:pyruvate formate lyase activating enzyme